MDIVKAVGTPPVGPGASVSSGLVSGSGLTSDFVLSSLRGSGFGEDSDFVETSELVAAEAFFFAGVILGMGCAAPFAGIV
jgi:hypothetical protein